MIIDILGVGRSGTTALYSLVQRMMSDNLEGKILSFYEPFLRDRNVIGEDYQAMQGKFQLVDSLSAAGIHAHTRLPMLISKAKNYSKDPFMASVYGQSTPRLLGRTIPLIRRRKQSTEHRLIKHIRACGRYRLIRQVAPNEKSLFIIRNPLDVANSIKMRFSFYGGEFHRDDESRFIQEVNTRYGEKFSKEQFHGYLESQLFYWYYSNRFALESFEEEKNKPNIIVYEKFFAELESALMSLCDFLNFDYHPEYAEFLSSPIGPISNKRVLPRRDRGMLEDYLGRYSELLTAHQTSKSEKNECSLENYEFANSFSVEKDPNYGLHSRAIAKKIAGPKNAIDSTNNEVTFSHLVNPVDTPKTSDLFVAQPITFESMRKARKFAGTQGIEVEQLAAFYPEDRSYIPDFLFPCEPLRESCLDFATLQPERKLPLVREIFDRARTFGTGEYIVYTNVDIALMPHFYFSLKNYMEQGNYDFINVCRRTLSSKYKSASQLASMYSDIGENHPGTDCFVFKRSLLEKFEFENIVFGAYFVAFSIRLNLYAFSKKTLEIPDQHLTFHIGDDRTWSTQSNYTSYNAKELDEIFSKLTRRDDLLNQEVISIFQADFEQRKNKLLTKSI